jgi:hypothetical protein
MKRHPALQDLSRDHQEFLLHARGLRWAIEGNRHAQPLATELRLWRSFWQTSGVHHLAEEEAVIAPACDHAAGDLGVFAQQVRRDHRWLREHAERLTEAEAEAVLEFAQRLQDHIRFEERAVFEGLQAALSDAELAERGAQLETLRRQRPDPTCAPGK